MKRSGEGLALACIFNRWRDRQNSRSGEVSEGVEALRTAGLETGATIFGNR